MNPPRSRVGLRVGARTIDVAVPAGVPLYEVLREAGIDLDDAHLAVVDSAGRRLDRYSVTGDQLADGVVLHVVSTARPARPARRRGAADDAPADPATVRPGSSASWLAGGAAAAVVIVAVAVLGMSDGVADLSPDRRAALSGALAVLAMLLAVVRGRPGVIGSAWPTVVAGLAGAAAGVVALDPAATGAGRLMTVAGLVGAVVPVAARWAVARRMRDAAADVAVVLLVVLAVATALVVLGVVLSLPPELPVAVLLGAVPLAIRALPALCVDVPDEQLIDVTLVARTAWAVRAPETPPLGAVNDRMVVRTVRNAQRRRDAATVVLSAAAPLLAPVVLVTAPGGYQRWMAAAACVAVVVALGLGPRTARGEVLRWLPRAGALGVVVEIALVGAGGDTAAPVTVALVLGALGVAAVSLAIGRGWRSVGMSRLADALEGLATVLALPLAIVGAGAVDAFRALVS